MVDGGHVHVVGAGMAGLAAASALAGTGHRVTIHDAAAAAGGRCRSFHDPELGRMVDNGNHLILGANAETFRYLARIGATDRLCGVSPARIDFADLGTGERWTIMPGLGPLWLLDPSRRVGGCSASAHLAGLRFLTAGPDSRVAEMVDPGSLIGRRFWHPLCVSVLNAPPEQASARLLRSVLLRTLFRGEAGCRPYFARESLDHALVAPAIAHLRRHGSDIHLRNRLRAVRFADGRVSELLFDAGSVLLAAGDRVILATPPWTAAELIPGLIVPDRMHAILNAHFAVPDSTSLPDGVPMLGLVGGLAEWVFHRPGLLSVTVSAADRLMPMEAAGLAHDLWADLRRAMPLLPQAPQAWRVVKERRATFAGTPEMERRRPPATAAYSNLVLAGDWTDTGLPATIEGAILSGHRAARLLREAVG